MFEKDGLEIERRFLIYATLDLTEIQTEPSRIEQTYLVAKTKTPLETHRVRKRVSSDGTTKYYYTVKSPGSGGARNEKEREIDLTEYNTLLQSADPDRTPIRKTRHVFPHAGLTMELDLFDPPLEDLIILEAELPSFETEVPIMNWATPFTEITHDPRFTNFSLSSADPAQIRRWTDDLRPINNP